MASTPVFGVLRTFSDFGTQISLLISPTTIFSRSSRNGDQTRRRISTLTLQWSNPVNEFSVHVLSIRELDFVFLISAAAGLFMAQWLALIPEPGETGKILWELKKNYPCLGARVFTQSDLTVGTRVQVVKDNTRQSTGEALKVLDIHDPEGGKCCVVGSHGDSAVQLTTSMGGGKEIPIADNHRRSDQKEKRKA